MQKRVYLKRIVYKLGYHPIEMKTNGKIKAIIILALIFITQHSMSQGSLDPDDLSSLSKKDFYFSLPQDSLLFLQNFELLKKSKKEGFLTYRKTNHDSSIVALFSVKIRFDTVKLDSDLFGFRIPINIRIQDSTDALSSAIRSENLLKTLLHFDNWTKLMVGVSKVINDFPFSGIWNIIWIVIFLALIGLFKIIF